MKIRIVVCLVAVIVSAGVISGCGSAASDTAPATAGIAKSAVPGSAQTGDAKASAAKALIQQVQAAIESCAASDTSGSYVNCGPATKLMQSDPGIAQSISTSLGGTCDMAQSDACITAVMIQNAGSYSVTATAATLPQPTLFMYASTNGQLAKTCTSKTATCPTGTW